MSENLNRLTYFVAIAEERTITAAAARLRVSKAVVSKQLQLLEDDLGATLVLRNARHFSLTETGETFYEAARAAVTDADELPRRDVVTSEIVEPGALALFCVEIVQAVTHGVLLLVVGASEARAPCASFSR